MKRWGLLAAAACALLCCGCLHGQPRALAPAFTARVVGLQVSRPMPVPIADSMQVTYGPPGTAMTVLLRGEDMVEVDSERSTVLSFADSTGHDLGGLGSAQQAEGRRASITGMVMSHDGSLALLRLRAPGAPAQGSTSVKAAALVTLVVRADLRKVRAAGLSVQKGTELAVGPFVFAVSDVNRDVPTTLAAVLAGCQGTAPVESLELGMEFSLEVTHGDAAVKAIRFFGPDGSEISGRVDIHVLQVTLDKVVDSADVEIEYWNSTRRVEVPVNVQSGLALE